MTSTTIIDDHRASGPRGAEAANPRRSTHLPARRLRFGGVLRSEWIKLGSLRSIRVSILVTVLVGLGLSALSAFALVSTEGMEGGGVLGTGDGALQSYLLFTATSAAPFLALIFGLIGVFVISSEDSSGMILSTLAAVPRRTPVFLAKAVVLAAISAAAALVLVIGGLAIAIAMKPEAAAQLGSAVVVSGGLGTIAYLVLISLFAFGVAGLLRSTAGGIAVVAGVTFVLPIALQILGMTGWEWVGAVSGYAPSALGGLLSQGAVEVASGPGYWGALAAMAVWVVVATIPAAVLLKLRDAK